MKRKAQKHSSKPKEGIVIRLGNGAPLSRTQVEFNRLMKNLEAAKARHAGEQARLDDVLATAIRELMPLVEELNQVDRDIIFAGQRAWQKLKLSAERRIWFGDLLCGKASNLLDDPVGLSDEEIGLLEDVVKEVAPPEDEEDADVGFNEEFGSIRTMMEEAARDVGLELDLSDLDPNADFEELQRIADERLRAAYEKAGSAESSAAPRRKATKAESVRERNRLAREEAKNRDLKSLFKQLAKAFHPDLEPDPLLKEHKVIWMQRLNAAYAADDLREMLQLEMEWLGEEATNLATAGDEKLKIYCMVLKEQLTDLKEQTYRLKEEPQYSPLRRFIDPYYGTLASPVTIRRELRQELVQHRKMLEILAANNANSRRMIYEWADAHAARSRSPFF